ncbi:hypothetical protein D3C81_1961360 [compost metagenome]
MRRLGSCMRARPILRRISKVAGTPDSEVTPWPRAASQNGRVIRLSLLNTTEPPQARWLLRMDIPNEYASGRVVMARSVGCRPR